MRKYKRKTFLCSCNAVVKILCGFFGLSLSACASDAVSYHKFGLNGEAMLCVPSSDLNPALIEYNDESTDLSVGIGHTPGFGFLFNADQVQRHLESGAFKESSELNGLPQVNTLGGSVGFLNASDSLRLGSAMRARNLSDEWYANGRCVGVVVTSLKNSNLFEVKCNAEDNYSNVLNRMPDRDLPLSDPNSVVVATCVDEKISAGSFAGHTLHSCRRVTIIDGYILDYQIQMDNLPIYQQIDKFLKSKLTEWNRNCSPRRMQS